MRRVKKATPLELRPWCVVCRGVVKQNGHGRGGSPKWRCCGNYFGSHPGKPQERTIPLDRDLLFDLYHNQRLTLREIAARFPSALKSKPHASVEQVLDRLRELGIARRTASDYATTQCIERACGRPIYKAFHHHNGSFSGTRCFDHWVQWRKKLAHDYQVNVRKWREFGFASFDSVFTEIDRLLPRAWAQDMREEIRQELVLLVLSRKIKARALPVAFERQVKRYFNEYQNRRNISIDTPLTADGKIRLADVLAG